MDVATVPEEDAAPAVDAAPPVDMAPVVDVATDPAAPDLPPGASPVERTVSVAKGDPTAEFGGMGGTLYADDCGTGVLIGYRGWKEPANGSPNNQFIISLQPVCGELVVRSGSTVVEVYKAVDKSRRGSTSDDGWVAVCEPPGVLVGFTVLAYFNMVENLQFRCAPLTVDAAGTGSISVGSVTPLQWSGELGNGTVVTTGCPVGQVGRGHVLGVGSWLDHYQMVCGTPSVQP
jgi:hypothetical protein